MNSKRRNKLNTFSSFKEIRKIKNIDREKKNLIENHYEIFLNTKHIIKKRIIRYRIVKRKGTKRDIY